MWNGDGGVACGDRVAPTLGKRSRNRGHSEIEVYAFESAPGCLVDSVKAADGRSRAAVRARSPLIVVPREGSAARRAWQPRRPPPRPVLRRPGRA